MRNKKSEGKPREAGPSKKAKRAYSKRVTASKSGRSRNVNEKGYGRVRSKQKSVHWGYREKGKMGMQGPRYTRRRKGSERRKGNCREITKREI